MRMAFKSSFKTKTLSEDIAETKRMKNSTEIVANNCLGIKFKKLNTLPMATKYRFGDSSIPHFIAFAAVNWIDVFSREFYKEIIS